MPNTLQIKRGLQASLPIGSAGELLFTTDTKRLYISDGSATNLLQGSSSLLTTGAIPFSDANGKLTMNASSFYWDNANNRLGIGTATPTSKLSVVDETLADIQSTVYNNLANNAGSFLVRKSRGTIASPSAILAGDRLGGFFFSGNNIGSAFYNGCALIAFAAENFTGSAGGSYFAFETTSNSSTLRTEKLRILGNGSVLIGTTTDAGFRLDVNGTARVQGDVQMGLAGAGTTSFRFFAGTSAGVQGNVTIAGLGVNGVFLGLGGGANATSGNNLGICRAFLNEMSAVAYGFVGLDNTVPMTFRFGAYGSSVEAMRLTNTSVILRPTTGNVLIGTTTDVASSILTIASTTKGFLPPRMTSAQKNAIATPAAGLVVYDNTVNALNYYNGTAWSSTGLTVTQVTPVTLTAASWTLVSGLYEYTYSNASITSTSIVDVIPLNSTIAIVQAAQVLPETLSSAGSVKLYATNLPTADIIVSINIFN